MKEIINDLEEYKNKFINDKEGNKHYEKNIDDFIEYIDTASVKSIDEISFDDFLNSISILNDKRIINRENTSHRYFEAIKSFYKFLKVKGYVEDIFERATHQNNYNEFIEKINFEDPKNNSKLGISHVKKILFFLDDYFFRFNDYNRLKNEKKKAEMNKYIKYMKLKLFIKLTLLAPFKKGVLSNIKVSDFLEGKRILKINKVKLELPNGLYHDLKNYRLFVEKHIIYNTDFSKQETEIYKNYIFGDPNDFYSKINDYLEQLVTDINKNSEKKKIPNLNPESLRQSAIYNMIDSNINVKLISTLSGTTISTLSLYYENFSNTIQIDNLRELSYFQYL